MVPVPKINSLIGKQWGPVTWEGDGEEDSIDTENFELSDSQGIIISQEVVVSPTSTEDLFTPSPLEIMPFPPLTEEIHSPFTLRCLLNWQSLFLNEMSNNTILIFLRTHQYLSLDI